MPQQQHILFVVNSFPPRVGGIERHIADLADELVRQGHRATVVTLAEVSGVTTENGITVHRLRRHFPVASVMSFPALGTARRLRQQFAHAGVTAISTHTRFFPMSWVGVAAGRRLGVPVLHTEHGSDFVRGVSPLIGLASRVVDVTVGRQTMRKATSVLGVSEQVIAFVKRLSGVAGTVFYNAINLDGWERPDDLHVALRRFVFVGRLVPGKGWDSLLSAAALLAADETVQPFTVEILGDGPDMASLRAQIEQAGLRSCVRAHGYVSGETVRTYLRDSVLVNPTTLAEGFQTTLLEALAGTCQIVTYNVPGAAQLASEGAPLFIVTEQNPNALATAMRAALDTPKPSYPFEQLKQWSWPQRVQQYLALVSKAQR
ncbi:glycosyltransferase family 4 protein [Cryobacterium sp. Y62]|uniref:glycosyltransferase family 4 protein n=1 Tax=Cryobacterium sp. Y62 TaxID=2048284 RepID=UPI001304EE65|nr:glycosyltransferase family 4 protein [Cryobacterium sp. Y62]